MKRLGKLELIAFITGFVLMAFELAAARILAPSIGSSTYVWTSVIGVIIAALSAGYYVGGRIADTRSQERDIMALLFAAAITTTFTLLSYHGVLDTVTQIANDARLQAVLAALILFAPTSFVLGMVSPYLAKLNVRSLHSSGRAIASLSALNSIGGIIGTFITGFFLFGYVGSSETIGIMAILLVIASWLLIPNQYLWRRIGMTIIVLLFVGLSLLSRSSSLSIDTPSAHYQIIEGNYNGEPVRGLMTGPAGIQSAVYTNTTSEPVFWYTREMARLTLQHSPKRVLMLGGGAFTIPQYLAHKLPNTQIDVVEIDPELKTISETYFNYQNPTNVKLIFQDARSYINQSKQTYDVILVDVYGDGNIPFTFITKEYGQAIAARLAPNGVVIVNIIAGSNGPCRDVLQVVNAAYLSALPHGTYFTEPGQDTKRTNYIAIYGRQPIRTDQHQESASSNLRSYTDNHAPAERLYYACHSVER